MLRRATILVVWMAVIVALSLVAFLSCNQPDSPGTNPPTKLEVGRPFPEIVLPNLADGSPGSISQFRGRKLLLHVFASW